MKGDDEMTRQLAQQIKRMSYKERLAHYEQEKNDLFFRVKGMSAEEISAEHERIRQKWMV